MAGFDLEEVFTILQTRRWGPGQIRLMYKGTDRSADIGKRGVGREAGLITLDFIKSYLADGVTFVIPALHVHQLCVRDACLRLGRELCCAVQANAYLSPPGGIGFPPHWDEHDVFAVQMAGRKEWKVEERATCDDAAQEDSVFVAQAAKIDANAPTYLLTEGMGLFVPRGHAHRARSLDEISLHVTLAIKRWTWGDLVEATLGAALRHDVRFRQAIPLDTLQGSQVEEGDLKQIVEVLGSIAEPAKLANAMAKLIAGTVSGSTGYQRGERGTTT